jgi:hypothetical protein
MEATQERDQYLLNLRRQNGRTSTDKFKTMISALRYLEMQHNVYAGVGGQEVVEALITYLPFIPE